MSKEINHRSLDQLRKRVSEPQGHVIEELLAGRLDRREFLRRGAVMGLSASATATILAACGGANASSSLSSSSGVAGKPNAKIHVGILTPSGQINPTTVGDSGLDLVAQTGEFLCTPDERLVLQPVLARKWTPNADGSVWTFTLRDGVKFHNGQPMTADDVVYTYKLNTDPKGSSSALSAFQGVLEPDGVRKVDEHTVAFHLEAPNGNFPYLTCSDNYNMIILPNHFDPAKWESTFIGTGPFKLGSYQTNQSASFVRNESYWGPKALPAASEFTFYGSQEGLGLAMQGRSLDVMQPLAFAGGAAIIQEFTVVRIRSSANRQMSLRCDTAPFTDARVRQAFALALDRVAINKGVYGGYADLGNDSPFAPIFPSTDPTVPQRAQDLAKAKALLQQAGHGNGLSVTLTTENVLGLPVLAEAIQADLKKIGVNTRLKAETQSQYFGQSVFGQSDWLDATVSLVDYGHRAVPNTFLTAALQSKGVWNAARFQEPHLRQADQRVCSGGRPAEPAQAGAAHPVPPAGRDAGDHPQLLQLPRRHGQDGQRRSVHCPRPDPAAEGHQGLRRVTEIND